MASQTLPPVPVSATTNGSAPGPTMTTNPIPPQNPPPTVASAASPLPNSPSNVSPTSPAFDTSAKALPPILPAHIPKDISVNSGLMSTARNRSASPSATKAASEGVTQNPAAILKTGGLGMSRVSDGPPLTSIATATNTAPALSNHAAGTQQSAPQAPPASGGGGGGEGQQETLTSPKSATSAASLDRSLTATSGIGSETSPTQTRRGSTSDSAPFQQQPALAAQPAQPSGPPFSPTAPSDPRGSISSVSGDPRGSISSVGGSRGKHTCPHCQQTFTRHHNLKSHLLTHSHEKPFQCTTCTSRFRRLHDLKRHQKLHTGERPHVCTTCGRKFARGDALARHARGEGGCAGRRSSMSALGEEGYEGDGDHMEGLEMSGGDVDDEMPDYEGPQTVSGGTPGRRTASLPSIRTRTMSTSSQSGGQAGRFHVPPPPQAPPPMHIPPQHHTYPPGGHQPPPPGVSFGQQPQQQPPQVGPKPPGSMSASSTSVGSGSITAGSSAPSTILSHELTASPRPLSPGSQQQHQLEGPLGVSRTPSVSSFHHQAIENRRRSNTGGTAALPPPSQLPQIGAGGQGQPQTSPRGSGRGGASRGSFSNALTSPQVQSGQGNIFSSGEEGIWAYIQNLEKRILDLEQKNSALESRMANYDSEKKGGAEAENAKA